MSMPTFKQILSRAIEQRVGYVDECQGMSEAAYGCGDMLASESFEASAKRCLKALHRLEEYAEERELRRKATK